VCVGVFVCVCMCVGFVMCWCFGNMLLYPYICFSVFFLRCKANARVKLAKTGHGPYSSKLVAIFVVLLLFVLLSVLFMCKCVL